MQGLGGAAADIHLLQFKSAARELVEQAGVQAWKHWMFMQGWVAPVYSQIPCLHMLEVLWEPEGNNKVRKKRYFPGAPSSSISVAMRGRSRGSERADGFSSLPGLAAYGFPNVFGFKVWAGIQLLPSSRSPSQCFICLPEWWAKCSSCVLWVLFL